MTAFPMPAEDSDGVPSSLEDVAAPPALLRLPKYYQVKKQLLDFTAAMSPGSPVPPERELAKRYGTSHHRQAGARRAGDRGAAAAHAGQGHLRGQAKGRPAA